MLDDEGNCGDSNAGNQDFFLNEKKFGKWKRKFSIPLLLQIPFNYESIDVSMRKISYTNYFVYSELFCGWKENRKLQFFSPIWFWVCNADVSPNVPAHVYRL